MEIRQFFRRLKQLVGRLSLIFLGLVLALAVAEVFARTFHLGSGGFWEPHPLYGWRNIPNADGWESCFGECAVQVTINSHGLRDREIPYGRTPGVRRILFLGDSMTAGMQVPLDKTFVKRLEARMNSDNDDRWETINGAVNGFSTDNALLWYRYEGYKYQPDLVVLGMYLANDIYENKPDLSAQSGQVNAKPSFQLVGDDELRLVNFPLEISSGSLIRAGTFLKQHFQLPRTIAQLLHFRSSVPQMLRPMVSAVGGTRGGVWRSNSGRHTEGDICDEHYSTDIEEAWAVSKALIKLLRDEVEESGAEFLVLVIPASPQLFEPDDGEWYCERPNAELREFLSLEEIPFLDPLSSLRKQVRKEGTALYYERDFHLNEHGHDALAWLIYDFLRSDFCGS